MPTDESEDILLSSSKIGQKSKGVSARLRPPPIDAIRHEVTSDFGWQDGFSVARKLAKGFFPKKEPDHLALFLGL